MTERTPNRTSVCNLWRITHSIALACETHCGANTHYRTGVRNPRRNPRPIAVARKIHNGMQTQSHLRDKATAEGANTHCRTGVRNSRRNPRPIAVAREVYSGLQTHSHMCAKPTAELQPELRVMIETLNPNRA